MFGYGSLVADDGPPRPPPTRDPNPGPGGFVADLRGYRRQWGVAMDNRRDLPGYKYYTDPEGRRPAVFVAFLDVVEDPDASVNGLCLPVDAAALAQLDERERNYVRVEVSDRVQAQGARVWTYTGSPQGRERLRRGRAAGRAVIDAGYLRAVQAGFAWLGEAELSACRPSLHADGLPVVPLRRHPL